MSESAQHLLPRENATLFEIACDLQEARILDIPTPIREAFRPLETPPVVLPFLAWERSVDLWDDHWPETKRRAVTDAALRLHKRKGTAFAIREYVRQADGRVTEIITPPQATYCGPSLTRAEREAWLARLPQVRVWNIRDGVPAHPKKLFYGGQLLKQFAETAFAVPSTALQRLKRRARWVVDGAETDVRVSDFGGHYRLHLPSTERARVFCGRSFSIRRFFVPSDAWRRLVTIRPAARLPWQSAVGPSLTPVTAEPERVTVPGSGVGRVFSGLCIARKFLAPTSAPLRIFQRYAVSDGRPLTKRPAFSFMGLARFGWPAHTARVSASIPGHRPRCAAGEGPLVPRRCFWMPSNARRRVQSIGRAIEAAKRLSDRIYLKIGRAPAFVAGRPFIAGSPYIVGHPN